MPVWGWGSIGAGAHNPDSPRAECTLMLAPNPLLPSLEELLDEMVTVPTSMLMLEKAFLANNLT